MGLMLLGGGGILRRRYHLRRSAAAANASDDASTVVVQHPPQGRQQPGKGAIRGPADTYPSLSTADSRSYPQTHLREHALLHAGHPDPPDIPNGKGGGLQRQPYLPPRYLEGGRLLP